MQVWADVFLPQVYSFYAFILSFHQARTLDGTQRDELALWSKKLQDWGTVAPFVLAPKTKPVLFSGLAISRIVVSLTYYPDKVTGCDWLDSNSFLNAYQCSAHTQRFSQTERWIFMIVQLRLNTGSFSVGQREANDSIVNTQPSGVW